MRKINFNVIIAVLTFLVLLGLHATPSAQASSERSKDLKLTVQGGNIAQADLSGGKGKFAVMRAGATISYSKFTFTYRRRFYDWDDKANLPFGNGRDDPWQDFSSLTLRARHDGELNKAWRYFVVAGAFSSFEKDMAGSYGGLGMAGVTYVVSPTLQWIFGGAVSYHPVRTRALPVIGINWNMGAKKGWSGAVGYPITRLLYRFNPQWALEVGSVGYVRSIYRLADDSTVEREGYLETEHMMAGAGFEYNPAKNCKINLSLRYFFNREMTIYDKDCDNEHNYDVDNSWGGVLSVAYTF